MNIILHPQAVHDMTPCQVMGLIEEPPHRDRLVSYGRGAAYASKKNERALTPGVIVQSWWSRHVIHQLRLV